MHIQTMAQSRPSWIPQPSTKLSPENVGSHQILSHRHAVANARKAQAKGKPSEKSPKGTASCDVGASTNLVSGDAPDPELGSTSDTTIPNPKKHPIILSNDDDSEDLPPTPTQQSDSSCPKKKKKGKKHTSTGM